MAPFGSNFSLADATVAELQEAFKQNKLSSRQLVEYYLSQILKLNSAIRGIVEVNPDVLTLADQADEERMAGASISKSGLHGIPVLLKENIATQDKLNTTAGSFALLGSVVPRDAGVVVKLRSAGAIIFGKANLSEWANYRAGRNGWSARGGQALNPYLMSADPSGSSTGSATSVAADMAAVSLGTETYGSIICPSNTNSVVGIKPTLGLTSRSGVIPISPRQDTVGPICRTVSDAVYVLDAIAGYDPYDKATESASKFIPFGGYKQFLNENGLKRKRLGIVRSPFFDFPNENSHLAQAFENHFQILSQKGAVLVDNLQVANISMILDFYQSGEATALKTEFKIALNSYLSELVSSPIRTLADAIAFNLKYSTLEMIPEFGHSNFLEAEKTTGTSDPVYQEALANMQRLTENGYVKLMTENNLDAMVTPNSSVIHMIAIGGFPGISVPAGYGPNGAPFGICFSGLHGYEPRLIEVSYAFEQATKVRKPPSYLV
ncbi:hypothetical protein NE237_016598 [Protea cynaroides]|uniref:Amidase domain-containing protein n=1 Tax=Protea cynaroides TaxID=273540 RepID=A0A9Q0HIT4_9MAGN|nr:hypothetical protein NE237_016598 [Protea cynaroides]